MVLKKKLKQFLYIYKQTKREFRNKSKFKKKIMVLHFEFKLHSAFYEAEVLLQKYSIDFLNDWLSYESELKYLMFFGESSPSSSLSSSFSGKGFGGGADDEASAAVAAAAALPPCLESTICLLRHNTILTNEEKRYILSLYIEDAYVVVAGAPPTSVAMLHVVLKSDHHVKEPTANILQFLCNHIYNQTIQGGILQHGLVSPLSAEDKVSFGWQDEPGWSRSFLEQNPGRTDALFMTHFTYRQTEGSLDLQQLHKLHKQQPLYISNYNLACYEVSKHIDEIQNSIERYKKSIKYLKKKQKEVRKEKKTLYNLYRDHYLAMVTNDDKKWHFIN